MNREYGRKSGKWCGWSWLILLSLSGGLTVTPVDWVVLVARSQTLPAAVVRGQSLLNQGLVNDAIAAFQQALGSFPQSLEAKLGLAQAYQKAGKDAQAWTAYQQVLAQDPKNQPALEAVGLLGGYRPEWQERGIEALSSLLNQTPNNLKVRGQRALLLGYQGRYPEAFADYQILLQNNPTPDTILGAAQIYTYSGDSQQGLALFQRYQGLGKGIPSNALTAYALALRETGNPAQAIQILNAELRKSQKFDWQEIEIRSSLAQAYEVNQQLPEALAILEPLLGKKEAALPLARSLTSIGRRQRRTDLYQEGAVLYRQVLAATPQPSPALVIEVADVLGELPAQRATALELYQQLAQQQPNNQSLLVKQLVLSSQLGRISMAQLQQRLLTALQPLPSQPESQRAIAIALVPLDPPDPALLPIYQSLIQAGVDVPFLNFRMAQIFLQRNQLTEATRALTAYQATKAGASDLAPELLLAEIDRRQGNLEASAGRYQSLITHHPSNELLSSALRGLAGIRLAQGRPDDAIALYDQLIQQNPNDLVAVLGRTNLAYQTKRITQAEAEAILNRWLKNQPSSNTPPELFSLVGSLPPSPERESLYNTLLAIDPDNISVLLRRLQLLAKTNPQEAEAQVQKLITRNPDNLGAYFVQGELAQSLGDLELATQAYQSILTRQPDNSGALMALAGIRFTQKQFGAATQLYHRVLEINPSEPGVLRNLAELSVAQDQPFTALEQFKTLNSEPTTPMTNNPELVNRIQRLEVDILKRRGFQPYWERY